MKELRDNFVTDQYSLFEGVSQQETSTSDIITRFLEICSKNHVSIVQFSKYTYVPSSVADPRTVFDVALSEIKERIGELVSLEMTDNEIALHSLVSVDGESYHVPMIDFASPNERMVSESLSILCQEYGINKFYLYASGRSFHAYGDTLIGEKDLSTYFGHLLLLNKKGSANVIDTRWIGHRLIGGYASLRITCNTNQYKRVPQYLKSIERIEDRYRDTQHLHGSAHNEGSPQHP